MEVSKGISTLLMEFYRRLQLQDRRQLPNYFELYFISITAAARADTPAARSIKKS